MIPKSLKKRKLFSFVEIVSVIKQKLEGSITEYERLCNLLTGCDDDVYVAEDYVDDLQAYTDELEDMLENFDRDEEQILEW